LFKPENPQTDPQNKCCALNVGGNENDKLSINALTTFTNSCTFNPNTTFKENITAKNIVATQTVEGKNKLKYEFNYSNYTGDIEDILLLTGYTSTLGGNASLNFSAGLEGESARFINGSENTITFRYVGANGINYPLRSVVLAPSTGVELIRYNLGWIAMR